MPALQLVCGKISVTAKEFGIFDIIDFCVNFGIFNSLWDYFDSDNLLCLISHCDADCTDAAVQIKHRFTAVERGVLRRLGIKFFALGAVDLIKRIRRYNKFFAEQFVSNGITAPNCFCFFAQNHI